MTKEIFLLTLKKELTKLNCKNIEEEILKISKKIDECLNAGISFDDIQVMLGNPVDLAHEIVNTNHSSTNNEKNKLPINKAESVLKFVTTIFYIAIGLSVIAFYVFYYFAQKMFIANSANSNVIGMFSYVQVIFLISIVLSVIVFSIIMYSVRNFLRKTYNRNEEVGSNE